MYSVITQEAQGELRFDGMTQQVFQVAGACPSTHTLQQLGFR